MELKEVINNIEDVLTNYHANTILRDRLLPVLTFLRELESSDSNEAMEALKDLSAYIPIVNNGMKYERDKELMAKRETIKNYILQAKLGEELADRYNLILNNALGETYQELAELKEKVNDIREKTLKNMRNSKTENQEFTELKYGFDSLSNLFKGSE